MGLRVECDADGCGAVSSSVEGFRLATVRVEGVARPVSVWMCDVDYAKALRSGSIPAVAARVAGVGVEVAP